jgi:hypothetical protein
MEESTIKNIIITLLVLLLLSANIYFIIYLTKKAMVNKKILASLDTFKNELKMTSPTPPAIKSPTTPAIKSPTPDKLKEFINNKLKKNKYLKQQAEKNKNNIARSRKINEFIVNFKLNKYKQPKKSSINNDIMKSSINNDIMKARQKHLDAVKTKLIQIRK